MKADCHIHALLDGFDWRASIHRHRETPHLATIRNWAKKDAEQPVYGGQARQDGWDYINAVAEGRA